MHLPYWIVLCVLLVGMFLSVKAGKLNVTGALTGGLVGFAIFLGAGLPGLVMLGTFFIVGSAATSWKLTDKIAAGVAESNKGQRTASQVIANAGVAGLVGLLAWLFPAQAGLFQVMLAASFASATADTCASELGNVYGRHYYNVLTWRTDTKGLDGVVSLEGTLLGFLGSCLIGLIYGIGFGWGLPVIWILMAGTVGNLVDSVLGASLERRGYLKNDTVNFLNTLVAALVALVVQTW
ncbi:DUF92 domain-containing protein [Spirosoma pollinicola]|uniref:DUF92 domain-containing protein n=1 Tax=Spirosoma pollinicola TaxID=2057025 RepID=A0A2K8YU21_9BACT|nr:DUF92 domain-containing protein [Spirosoma pollinicola]AUD01132.1 DUF92 domain-containing protein [Spirosoma pollinicola]